MRVKDKIAMITGAGTGIGQATAVLLAEEGAYIIACGRRQSQLEETIKLVEAAGGKGIACAMDARSQADVEKGVARAIEEYGRIDILFNNAGVGYSAPYFMGSVKDTPIQDWKEVISINVESVFLCSKYVIPYMIKQGGGAILNCSSINGVIGCGADSYSASKGAIIALTRAMAVDNAKHNIRVNCVSPGATITPMIEPALEEDKGFWEYWSNVAPIKRMADSREVAYAALFLVSDESAYITGQNLMVDGGLTIS
ncbi:MAG: SDR family oxidoreductase [Oscillospiraceae bacterium]|nr:SDR family oxidoreductase [Oscillospiraceae bacterium]